MIMYNRVTGLMAYLEAMQQVYKSIQEKGMELYVIRAGHSANGWSMLFALPNAERKTNEDNSIKLLDSDLEILKQTLHPMYIERIKNRDGDVKMYLFDKPKKEENLSLNRLETIHDGKVAEIFYRSPDVC